MRADNLGGHFALDFDVTKAHRRIPVVPEEWGLLACRARPGADPPADDELIYINCVGTFGIGSAGYWWSRLAALLHRMALAVAGPDNPTYLLTFSDDGLVVGAGPRFERSIAIVMLLLAVLDVPLTIRKTRGGTEVGWVGYQVDVLRFRVGFAETRRAWAEAFCDRVAGGGPVAIRDVREGLGRLVFIAGPLFLARPFLGPVFAWVAASPANAVLAPPSLVRVVLSWFRDIIRRHPWHCATVGRTHAGEAFRVDARADAHEASIGGWVPGPAGDTSTAPWFAHRVTAQDHPWAWERGSPQRAVAALELLAVVYAVMAFIPADPAERLTSGTVAVSGVTDNQGNESVARRLSTAKAPLNVVLMELAAQLGGRNRVLNLVWRPRDLNVEADALSNFDVAKFDPARRIDVEPLTAGLLCLPALARALAEPAPARVPVRRSAPPGVKRSTGKRLRLRLREPW